MKNSEEVVDILSQNVKELIAGTRPVGIAKEINNACGKRLSIIKLHLQENEMRHIEEPTGFFPEKPKK